MSSSNLSSSTLPLVGLLPGAGLGSRVHPLPCSKEVLPVRMQSLDSYEGPRVQVVSQFLLDAMREGGVERAYWLLRDGKWDIPQYWADGAAVGVDLAYLMAPQWALGSAFTINEAYPFVRDSIVVLGFPDVFFRPLDAFGRIVQSLQETEADVMLGLFPASEPAKADMVEMAADGRIRRIHVKPVRTDLTLAWVIAAWRPSFTEWMHHHAADVQAQAMIDENGNAGLEERHPGHFLQQAIAEGLDVRGTPFRDGAFLDVGTPAALARVMEASTIEDALATPQSVGTERAVSRPR